MTKTIKEASIIWIGVGVLLLVTWGGATAILLVGHTPTFIPLFLYIYGSITAFILLNLQYRWIEVK